VPSSKPKPCLERKQFGKNIVRLRTKTQLTQAQFAEKVGLTVRYVQQIEAGDNWPSLPKLAALRDALKCSWDDLMAGISNSVSARKTKD
jgi:transcriptional regulator with XRE-family HTH domain